MEVLFDHQAFNCTHSGVSLCFAKLIKHLPTDIQYRLSIIESNNIHLIDENIISNLRPESLNISNFLHGYKFKGKRILYNMLDHFSFFPSTRRINENYTIKLLEENKFDIFHPTLYNPYFLKYLNKKPFVITIHDMISELYDYPEFKLQSHYKNLLQKKAAHIIAVSNKTKEDAMRIFNIPDSKITTIYHAVDIPNNQDIKDPIIKGKYILYVGKRNTYKNFTQFVEQTAKFMKKHQEFKLVCTGIPFNTEEEKMLKEHKIYDKTTRILATTAELNNLYKYAFAFVYPSKYEGFGIPILEAFANKCPTILSNCSCFPEIAGDACLYFETNEESCNLLEKYEELFNMNDTEKECLINKEIERLKIYSWSKSSKQLAEVYKQLM